MVCGLALKVYGPCYAAQRIGLDACGKGAHQQVIVHCQNREPVICFSSESANSVFPQAAGHFCNWGGGCFCRRMVLGGSVVNIVSRDIWRRAGTPADFHDSTTFINGGCAKGRLRRLIQYNHAGQGIVLSHCYPNTIFTGQDNIHIIVFVEPEGVAAFQQW